MQKVISTKMHGVLDYLTVPMLIALPRMLGWSKGPTQLLTFAGLGTLGYSVLTRYELGLYKTISMKTHLLLDAISAATLIAAPLMFRNESGSVKGTLVGLGLYELGAVMLSQTEPPLDEKMLQVGESAGGTVHDVVDRLREQAAGA